MSAVIRAGRVSRVWVILVATLSAVLVLLVISTYADLWSERARWTASCHSVGGRVEERPPGQENPLVASGSDWSEVCLGPDGQPLEVP